MNNPGWSLALGVQIEMPTFASVAEARTQDGVRLVLTVGAPGPWGEAAKGLLHVKKIAFVPVRQEAGSDNPELVAWTGIRNAPQIIAEDDKPLHAWLDLIHFAENRTPSPSLIPDDPNDRVLMFGMIHELAGTEGYAWSRRLTLFKPIMDLAKQGENPGFKPVQLMAAQYGYQEEAAERASDKVAEVLNLLSERLRLQSEAGNGPYLIGDRLSALDIYWAAFAAMVAPLSPERCAMPDYLRQAYGTIDETITSALTPSLLKHRDYIYDTYLELPVVFE